MEISITGLPRHESASGSGALGVEQEPCLGWVLQDECVLLSPRLPWDGGPSPGGMGSCGVRQWGQLELAKRGAETFKSQVIKKQGGGGGGGQLKKKKAEVCLGDAAWKC